MKKNPFTPDPPAGDLEERMTYLVQKLIILWRADNANAYTWLTKRKDVVRLFLLVVMEEIAKDEVSGAALRADCSEIIAYVKSKS